MTLDSAGVAGPSPMQALAFALAGCMAMDVVHILQEGSARAARIPCRPERRASARESPPVHGRHAARHDCRKPAAGCRRSGHRSLARQVLLGLSLAASGHHADRHFQHQRGLMPAATRREYLDWLRGVAVIIMIEAHLFDSWTGGSDRQTFTFDLAMIVGGMGAPLFLFLAGVAVPLSATSALNRTCSMRRASSAVVRRGFEIFGLAFLFRIQAWVLGWSSPKALLKVDVLNIMGPSIAAAGALWGAAGSTRGRLATFSLATLGLALSTPLIRTSALRVLPDPLEALHPTAAGALALRVLSLGRLRVCGSDRRRASLRNATDGRRPNQCRAVRHWSRDCRSRLRGVASAEPVSVLELLDDFTQFLLSRARD